MSGPLDVGGLINLLETSDLQAGQEVKDLVLHSLRGNREAWLVNALVDSYVLSRLDQCLDIITAVSEPHDKHVFDRLLDHLKGPHKQAALTILATLVYKQPAWLHKLLNHGLFSQLLKCLKTDTDVPVLLSGLLVVTALLPVVPVTINQYLHPIFDVFTRLAALCLKPPGNPPELYKYHLLVGVYSLHHRLYGMYPYHFLTYLRNVYLNQDQQQVFEHVIKPMIDKVRLHPMLFTTSREKEVSKDRWRQKEVHDILVECAQFSLDLTEGSTSEMSTPGPQKMADHILTGPKGGLADLMMPSPGALVATVDPAAVLKQQRLGVMTPPLGQSHDTPSTQGGRDPTPIQHQQGAALVSPVPENQKTPKSKKRLSQTGLTLVGKIPTPTDVPLHPEGWCSVPPSPLRPDFTTDPPFSAHRMQAIRKLSFHQLDTSAHQSEVGRALEKALTNLDRFPRQAASQRPVADQTSSERAAPSTEVQDVTSDITMATQAPSNNKTPVTPGTADNTKAPSGELVAPSGEDVESESKDAETGDLSASQEIEAQTSTSEVSVQGADLDVAPSLTQLPRFLDSLDNHPDPDVEVSEITKFTLAEDEDEDEEEEKGAKMVDDDDDENSESSDTPSHLPAHIRTAASVADFMKKVNRLRFNSINMSRETIVEKTIKSERSRSCPDLEPKEKEVEKLSPLPKQPVVPPRVPTIEKITRSNSSQTSLYALSSALLEKAKKAPPSEAEASTETEGGMSVFEKFPYEELFSMSLPFSPYIQCYSCVVKNSGKTKEQPALDDQSPLFASYSPVELLDRILDQGQRIHRQGKAFTSPGAPPSGSDVGVLHGQIEMLRHQLMFERHKRELHAQRNRRLLSRITKTVALQEQNSAMKDQLQLQERELTTLRHELQQQQRLSQQLQQTTASHEADTERRNKTYSQKLESLQNHNRELEGQLEEAKADKDKANKEFQSYQAKVDTLTKEVELLTTKNQVTQDLQEQVKRLNKELLLMGELQQKYQSRLVALNMTENSQARTQFLLDTYKVELNTVKNNLSEKTIEADAVKSRLQDCLSKLSRKDENITDIKLMLESARDTYREEIEAVEEKYAALKKSHLALQTEFLTVHHQMSLAEQRASRPRGYGRIGGPAHSPVDIDGSGASTAGEGETDGSRRRTDGLPEWSAPASISSVESAEEAVAMEMSSQ